MIHFLRFLADPIHVDNVPIIGINQKTLAQALSLTFVVTGALAVLFILIGAVRYAISAGDQAGTRQAKNTILYAVIGLVISLSAFAIVQFVLVSVTKD